MPSESKLYARQESAARPSASALTFSLCVGSGMAGSSLPDMAVNSVVPEMKTRYALGILRSPIPPLVLGMARTFDLGGVLDEDDWDLDPQQDTRMLERDWIAVGDDLRNAMADF